jgi:transposase
METIGCDLGDKTCELFLIRPDETTFRLKPVKTDREAFRKFFAERPAAHVVLEVGCHSRWISKELREMGHVVTIANPRKVRLIAESDDKDDQTDAELLARLGRADVKLLRPVEHRGEQVQEGLAIVKVRDALVGCRTKLVNQARGLTKSFGYRLPKCEAEVFWRLTKEEVPEQLKQALSPVYGALEDLAEQIAKCDRAIKQLAKQYPDVEVVGQPKGVGLLTALVFILTIEDKNRFQKSRDVGPFIGLTPRKRKSSTSNPQLHITKAGDGLLRKYLVQSAHYVLGPFGPDTDLRAWGLGLCKRGGKNAKKRARIAVARKLAVLMHRLWVTGEEYEPIGYQQKRTKVAQQGE